MHPGQRLSLTALNGATIDGVYVRPLRRDEKLRLFDGDAHNTAFAWVETQMGNGWFAERRLAALT
jgi:hypothetical protein